MKMGFGIHAAKAKRPEECQDYAQLFEGDDISIICIADGISSSAVSAKAAKMNVEYAIKFFQRPEVWEPGAWRTCSENNYKLIERIIKDFNSIYRDNYDGLEATLTAVARRESDGQIRCIHIGDGAVLGITEGMDIFPIQYPVNILGNKRMTVCTVYYAQLENMMGLWAGNNSFQHLGSNLAGIVICSDGGSSMLLDCPDIGAARLRKLMLDLQEQNDAMPIFQDLAKEIALSKYTSDDVSVAGMLFGSLNPQSITPQLTAVPEERVETTDLQDIPPYMMPVIEALRKERLNIEELEEQQICMKGRALETLMPLIKAGIVQYNEGKFFLQEG